MRYESSVRMSHERVLSLLRRFGFNATSFQVLEPGFEYWFFDDEACVAYVDTGRAWVAAGAPIAAEERFPIVSRAFVAAARSKQRRALFFATERRFVDSVDFETILIGEQPIFDPRRWEENVRRSSNLREQLRRATAKGVIVEELQPGDVSSAAAPQRVAVEELIARWMGSKPMPPMGFLVRLHPFAFPAERRLFVAKQGERVVGFAGVVPVYARGGWFIEDLIRAPNAPNGTVERLVDAAMRRAAAEGSAYLTLGLAPLAGAVEFWLHALRRYGSALYDFAGLQAFKAKFKPETWTPIYLSYPKEISAYRAMYDSLAAFSQHGLLRYGLETLLRGPDVVMRMLALLLVPWTLLLASVPSSDWFPAEWVRWAWVVFDVGLCLGLFVFTRRRNRRLADVLTGLVMLDAVVTLGEVLSFNVPRIKRPDELLLLVIAVLAPTLASVVLWNVRKRLSRTMPILE